MQHVILSCVADVVRVLALEVTPTDCAAAIHLQANMRRWS